MLSLQQSMLEVGMAETASACKAFFCIETAPVFAWDTKAAVNGRDTREKDEVFMIGCFCS